MMIYSSISMKGVRDYDDLRLYKCSNLHNTATFAMVTHDLENNTGDSHVIIDCLWRRVWYR